VNLWHEDFSHLVNQFYRLSTTWPVQAYTGLARLVSGDLSAEQRSPLT